MCTFDDLMDQDELERDDVDRGSTICPYCGWRSKSILETCCDSCAQADAGI